MLNRLSLKITSCSRLGRGIRKYH